MYRSIVLSMRGCTCKHKSEYMSQRGDHMEIKHARGDQGGGVLDFNFATSHGDYTWRVLMIRFSLRKGKPFPSRTLRERYISQVRTHPYRFFCWAGPLAFLYSEKILRHASVCGGIRTADLQRHGQTAQPLGYARVNAILPFVYQPILSFFLFSFSFFFLFYYYF